MSEPFDINGVQYKTGRLDGFQQFHIVRRIAPLLVGIGDIYQKMGKYDEQSWQLEDLISKFGGLANILVQMSDEDVDHIIKMCLGVCKRQDSGGWAPVTSQTGSLMFQDIDMMVMLSLTYRTIQENLGGFIKGASTPQSENQSQTAHSSR